jgi:hypothetical protein
MARTVTVLLGLLTAAAIAVAGIGSASACACGALLRAREVSEKALVSLSGGTETIVPGLSITRAGDHAAVVFPVPARPRIRALPSGMHLFAQLDDATTPKGGGKSVGGGAPGAGAPSVISHKVIGGYTVTVLRGGSGETVRAWLSRRGYVLPAGAGPILGNYISRGWYFVAIRLAHRAAGEIRPLAIRFAAKRLIYPMKLSHAATEPVDLDLFLDTGGPVAVSGASGLSKTFAGAVSGVRSELSKQVRALLPAPYLTRVQIFGAPPGRIRSDIVAVPTR